MYDEATLAIPGLDGLNNVSIWRCEGPVGGHIVYGAFQLVEYENRRPSMVMGRFFFLGLKDHFENA